MKRNTYFSLVIFLLLTIHSFTQNPLAEVEGTVKAKELELYDSNGDLRFRINADSGRFEMLSDDTTWIAFNVDSTPHVIYRGRKLVKSENISLDDGACDTVTDDIGNQRQSHCINRDGTTLTQFWDENGTVRYTLLISQDTIIEEHFNSSGTPDIATHIMFDHEHVFIDNHNSSRCDIGSNIIKLTINSDTTKITATKITTDTVSVQSVLQTDFIVTKSANMVTNLGDFHVEGQLSKLGGAFKIDHPKDPENKYLYHSFVESPEMMNVYNGNISTDSEGRATVTLPDYFEALNIDFRYQLTVIGTFAQAIVSKEIKDNQFDIMTDKPNVKVSWQVTGIRNDRYACENRIQAEVDKEPENVGTLLYDPSRGLDVEESLDRQD